MSGSAGHSGDPGVQPVSRARIRPLPNLVAVQCRCPGAALEADSTLYCSENLTVRGSTG